MRRHLAFFDSGSVDSFKEPLENAFKAGARRALMVATEACDPALAGGVRNAGLALSEKRLATFQKSDLVDTDVLLVPAAPGADVSRVLHACIGENVVVIAPVTDHHHSKRTLFLMCIPKAGTHMVIRLFSLMGLERSPEREPRPGTWCTPMGYAYHAPCRELMADDAFDPVGRRLLLRSPAIFVYRNPLDIVVSERDWFVKTPHTFSGYLNGCADESEQLARLIADHTVMGTIRDRINRYVGWMNFSNVIPLSYEELVGSRGGGSDAEQADAIWALQLKLHIPGDPYDFGAHLYDPASATFSEGRVGRYLECFNEHHFALVDSLPKDFMQALGYHRGSKTSSRVMALRERPLVIKELLPDALYEPRLVREGVMGWNIVEVAGRYYPVRQGEHIMSAAEAENALAKEHGFTTLRDAIDAVIDGKIAAVKTESQVVQLEKSITFLTQRVSALLPDSSQEPRLLEENYRGFNLVACDGKVWAVDMSSGPVDLRDCAARERLTADGKLFVGSTLDHARVAIDQLWILQNEIRSHIVRELDGVRMSLADIAARIDGLRQEQRQSVDGVKTNLQSQIDDLKRNVFLRIWSRIAGAKMP